MVAIIIQTNQKNSFILKTIFVQINELIFANKKALIWFPLIKNKIKHYNYKN